MNLDPVRGIKYGIGAGLICAFVIPINHYLRGEAIRADEIIAGSIVFSLLSGLLATLTGKIGFDVGES